VFFFVVFSVTMDTSGDEPLGVIKNEAELANSSEEVFSPPPSRPISPQKPSFSVSSSVASKMRSREISMDFAGTNELNKVNNSQTVLLNKVPEIDVDNNKVPEIDVDNNNSIDNDHSSKATSRVRKNTLDDITPGTGLPGLGTSLDDASIATPPLSASSQQGNKPSFSNSGGGRVATGKTISRQLTSSPVNRNSREGYSSSNAAADDDLINKHATPSNPNQQSLIELPTTTTTTTTKNRSRGLVDADAPPPFRPSEMNRSSSSQRMLSSRVLSNSSSVLNTSKIQGSISNERINSGQSNNNKNTDRMSGSYVEQLNKALLDGLEPSKPIRLNKCHDFAWSRTLWAEAARTCFKVSCLVTGLYLFFFWFILGYMDGLSGVDPWYLMSATITTVSVCVVLAPYVYMCVVFHVCVCVYIYYVCFLFFFTHKHTQVFICTFIVALHLCDRHAII
jgi:hypothetical protein